MSTIDDFRTESGELAPAHLAPVRPLYWSIRRELWENRSLTLAPLIVALVTVFAFSVHSHQLPGMVGRLATMEPAKAYMAVFTPFSLAASAILFTSFVTGAFYCLDALYGERRDRSILFWKSLPVSDRTTVLSKALIPLAVLPLQSFVIAIAADVVILLLGSMALATRGTNPMLWWQHMTLPENMVVMAYGVAAHVLWYAPLYAWMLLVSAWARRAVPLWVVLPPVLIAIAEQTGAGTRHFASLMQYRLSGALTEAFTVNAMTTPVTKISQLTRIEFLVSPGLWSGLAFAAACLAAAVRLRRNRQPV